MIVYRGLVFKNRQFFKHHVWLNIPSMTKALKNGYLNGFRIYETNDSKKAAVLANRKYKFYAEKPKKIKKDVQVEAEPKIYIFYRGCIFNNVDEFVIGFGITITEYKIAIREGMFHDRVIFETKDKKEADYYVDTFGDK